MDNLISLQNVIEQSFTQYAGATIQSRAIVDVRDCIKPSARQIYYCLYTDKFVHERPFNKTLKGIGSSMRMYIHGDSSCEGIIMRSGQPFSMRYPLVEVEGSYGNLTESGNWAAPRYTASRLSEISNYLLQETDKFTVQEWADNYDDTEQYPRVLSSLGFYNIVNGSMGIATGIASSIPQFNLVEVNEAFVKLLENPQADFDDIVCYPDFSTGGTILNKEEVYQSLKKGSGKGCVIQATIEYDKSDNCLIVTDLPYGVYTNTICGEIEKIVNANENIGIVNINDLTGENVCVKIYLSKNIDPDDVKTILYNNTSLQKTYGINMTMLDNGKTPKIFGWREALLAHLSHEKQVYINLYNHKLNVLFKRLEIVNGLLKAIDKINEVIDTIKNSNNANDANEKLQRLLEINDEQAKAILEIKLVRLAHLEVNKFIDERKELEANISNINSILADEELLKKEMTKRFEEVSKKFGDKRRTKVIQKDITKTARTVQGKKEATIEQFAIAFNPLGYIQKVPVAKFSKQNNFTIFKANTNELICLYSNIGKLYRIAMKNIRQCGSKDKGVAIGTLLKLEKDEKIIAAFPNRENEKRPYLIFSTKDGMVKKSSACKFIGTTQNLKGVVAMNVSSDIVAIQESNGDDIVLETKDGYVIRFDAENLSDTGKGSKGVKGIALQGNDYVVKCNVVRKDELPRIQMQKRGGKGKNGKH